MSNSEHHTAQFIYTAEHDLLLGGVKETEVNMSTLTHDQIVDGVREGNINWFNALEQNNIEAAHKYEALADACLHQLAARAVGKGHKGAA